MLTQICVATSCHCSAKFSICLYNGMVPSGNNPFLEPIMIQFSDEYKNHQVSMNLILLRCPPSHRKMVAKASPKTAMLLFVHILFNPAKTKTSKINFTGAFWGLSSGDWWIAGVIPSRRISNAKSLPMPQHRQVNLQFNSLQNYVSSRHIFL